MRWLFAGVVVAGLVILGIVAASPALHSPGNADCSTLADNSSQPEHGSHESGMYAEENGTGADCPVDDGVAMGVEAETE